jgi:hypothetical protein
MATAVNQLACPTNQRDPMTTLELSSLCHHKQIQSEVNGSGVQRKQSNCSTVIANQSSKSG